MSKVGKYEILEEIGRGGFAVVYKARDTALDRIVALKVLDQYWAKDPSFVARFHQEARTTANLRHPNIVTVYEAGEADGQLFIAMEYVPGRTLHEVLETEGVLLLRHALPILVQVADALDYAHAQGIVHRDVKPSNVIVEQTERGLKATLTDFGLIKAMGRSTVLTAQGTLLGSPEYMAPEQADPERAAQVGPAADRYALGIVAYQLLTGRVPFPGNTPATLNAHEHKPVPHPRSLRPELHKTVARALLNMLAKDPADRFASAQAFVAQIRQAPLVASKARRRRKMAATWFLVVGGVMALALMVALAIMSSSPQSSSIYQAGLITYVSQEENGKDLRSISPDGTHVTLVQGVADVWVLAVSPGQSHLAIAFCQEGTLDQPLGSRLIRTTEASGVTLVVVSADGKEQSTVVSDVDRVDAAYASDERLVVAFLIDSTVTYISTLVDGSQAREMYRSYNVLDEEIEVTEVPKIQRETVIETVIEEATTPVPVTTQEAP